MIIMKYGDDWWSWHILDSNGYSIKWITKRRNLCDLLSCPFFAVWGFGYLPLRKVILLICTSSVSVSTFFSFSTPHQRVKNTSVHGFTHFVQIFNGNLRALDIFLFYPVQHSSHLLSSVCVQKSTRVRLAGDARFLALPRDGEGQSCFARGLPLTLRNSTRVRVKCLNQFLYSLILLFCTTAACLWNKLSSFAVLVA